MAYIDELLGSDEQILYVARQHLFVLASRVLGEMLLIALLIVTGLVSLRAFGQQYLNGIVIGEFILLTCIAISAVLVLSMLLDYFRWQNTQYILTDRRVLQLDGVFNRQVIDSSLEKVNDIALRQSWFGRLFNFGDLEILTASDDIANRMERISSPLAFQRAMFDAKSHYDRGFGYLDPALVAPYERLHNDLDLVLSELATLRDRGILSSDEFEAKKRELLSRI